MKANEVLDEFLKVNFIKPILLGGRHVVRHNLKRYKCPKCGYDGWAVNRYYYPYLYLYIQEIKKGLRNI